MSEEVRRLITEQDVQNAARLAAVEAHVHNTKDAIARLEVSQNVQMTVMAEIRRSSEDTRIAIAAITAQLAEQKNKMAEMSPIKDTVIRWGGALAFCSILIAILKLLGKV